MKRRARYIWLVFYLLIAGFLIWMAARAGDFLIVDAPRRSDVIVVLAGETDFRPRRALQLLEQGYAGEIILDVPTNAKLYEFTQVQLAQRYIQDLPQAGAVSVCPIDGLSTKDESRDAEKCVQRLGAGIRNVLIVTSDFHTRRALEVFRREVPEYGYSAGAARNPETFGSKWWMHRQWAKTFVDEWLRLIWWNTVDRWR
jgi:uncharacterized SAM-binding protein YcdF (DUF218 family)